MVANEIDEHRCVQRHVSYTDKERITVLGQWIKDMPWWGQCVLVWLAALAVLTVAGLIAVRVLDLREGYDPVIGVSPYSVPGIWARWDSPYYINLAERGYEALPYAMGYFPLYPLLMVGLSRITGMSLAMAGMLISQASYLAAILAFYKLAHLVHDDHAYAMRCVLYLVLFPSAFFFFAIYAEPVTLALVILGVYLVLRSRPLYVWAGVALGLGSLARPVGWLADIVLAIEFAVRRKYDRRSLISVIVGLGLSAAGVVAFVLYLYRITGTFLAIPRAQAEWLRQWQYPWITYWKSVKVALLGTQVPGDWFLYMINWSDLLFTTLALALTGVAAWWAHKGRCKWSLVVYLVGSLAFLLSQQGLEMVPLWGMTRWVAALFPIYLIMADIPLRRIFRWAILWISGGLEALLFAWWSSGRWVG
jgi:Gpi18-like mannosyltransferase